MAACFKNTYKGRKVFVTGHTGFKGSWLVSWLLNCGAQVTGYALPPPTRPSLFNILDLQKKIKHQIGDIRDYSRLRSAIKRSGATILFHLAAQPLVGESYEDPKYTFDVNVTGTVNVLEALKECPKTKAGIIVTSDKCYENIQKRHAYKETDPLGGHDPYSASKGCAELVVASYRNVFAGSHGRAIGISSVRAGNVIGGGDWGRDRLIPDCVRALIDNKKIKIRQPRSERPWQFVLESLAGYLWVGACMLKNRGKYDGAYNFGSPRQSLYPVDKVVREFLKVWGRGSYTTVGQGKYFEQKTLLLDISKAQKKLKWRPVYTTSRAITQTAQWYKAYYSSKKTSMFDVSVEQIEEYIQSARKRKIAWAM